MTATSRTDPVRPPGPAIHADAAPHPRERTPRGSTEEIQAGLAEILEEVAGVTPADATPEKSFTDDLDVDSLSMVEIATAVEDKFGVAIPDDELGNIKTVGDAIAYIEKNQG